MIIKAEVTPQEKELIKQLARNEGMSVSAYIKQRVLDHSEPTAVIKTLLTYIETQAEIAQKLNSIVTTVLKNKAIYEVDIMLLIDQMKNLEAITAAFLKEINGLMKGELKKRGHTGHKKY